MRHIANQDLRRHCGTTTWHSHRWRAPLAIAAAMVVLVVRTAPLVYSCVGERITMTRCCDKSLLVDRSSARAVCPATPPPAKRAQHAQGAVARRCRRMCRKDGICTTIIFDIFPPGKSLLTPGGSSTHRCWRCFAATHHAVDAPEVVRMGRQERPGRQGENINIGASVLTPWPSARPGAGVSKQLRQHRFVGRKYINSTLAPGLLRAGSVLRRRPPAPEAVPVGVFAAARLVCVYANKAPPSSVQAHLLGFCILTCAMCAIPPGQAPNACTQLDIGHMAARRGGSDDITSRTTRLSTRPVGKLPERLSTRRGTGLRVPLSTSGAAPVGAAFVASGLNLANAICRQQRCGPSGHIDASCLANVGHHTICRGTAFKPVGVGGAACCLHFRRGVAAFGSCS